MEAFDTFLNLYGIAALFLLMLVKAAGLPVPIPGDLIMLAAAGRAAEGKWPLWQAFVAILLALVLGALNPAERAGITTEPRPAGGWPAA